MIIKSKNDTYANFRYDNSNLEEVSSYNYLGIDIHHKLNCNYSIKKRINGGQKAYFGLENNYKAANLMRNIEQIQKRFITYNLKIKNNTPYPILLIEVGLPSIESLAMTRLLLYKHKINNMGDHRLPNLAFNSSQNHLRLKRCWYKDTRA